MSKNYQDAIFIRHAESNFNQGTLDYVARNNIVYDWQHLSKDHNYLTELKYCYDYLDCPITKKGYGECSQAKLKLANFNPDVILVSPLNRALITCNQIFPNPACPVLVQPILAEGLRSSCDYSSDVSQKIKNFPLYNFQKVVKAGEFWFLDNQSEENQSKYKSLLLKSGQGKSYQQKVKLLLEFMLETWIFQTPTNLRKRTDRLCQLIKEYKLKYNKIALVTHYNIIRFTLATQYNEHDEPYHCHIDNCQILPFKPHSL